MVVKTCVVPSTLVNRLDEFFINDDTSCINPTQNGNLHILFLKGKFIPDLEILKSCPPGYNRVIETQLVNEIKYMISAFKEGWIVAFWPHKYCNSEIGNEECLISSTESKPIWPCKHTTVGAQPITYPKVTFQKSTDLLKPSYDMQDEATRINIDQIQSIKHASAVQFLAAKDDYTMEHCLRVSEYARYFAKNAGRVLAWTTQHQEHLADAGFFHDFGKIVSPEILLRKKGKLTGREHYWVNRHSLLALSFIEGAAQSMHRLIHYPVLCHHLSPNSISVLLDEIFDSIGQKQHRIDFIFATSILKISDMLDSFLSDRPYRERVPYEEAIKIISDFITSRDHEKKENCPIGLLPEYEDGIMNVLLKSLYSNELHDIYEEMIRKYPIPPLNGLN